MGVHVLTSVTVTASHGIEIVGREYKGELTLEIVVFARTAQSFGILVT
jgi:hypothetical protein